MPPGARCSTSGCSSRICTTVRPEYDGGTGCTPQSPLHANARVAAASAAVSMQLRVRVWGKARPPPSKLPARRRHTLCGWRGASASLWRRACACTGAACTDVACKCSGAACVCAGAACVCACAAC
eukprot:13957-Chlamydomonas_euryale.AAC.1